MSNVALIIRHDASETLADNYTRVLQGCGFILTPLNIFESYPSFDTFNPPRLESVKLIMILGGPQSANDKYPGLLKEIAYLSQAKKEGIPIFGICLGAQILSKILGGTVEPSGGYQFGLRKIWITSAGSQDTVFSKIRIPLVPTLHGECFTIPPGGVELASGYMLGKHGDYRKISMAFKHEHSYGFQFEPQLTVKELETWNNNLMADYRKMGPRFNPTEEADTNLREFVSYAPFYESQSREMLFAFLKNAGLT